METSLESPADTKHPTGITKSVPVSDCANPGNAVASCADIDLPQAEEWFKKGSAATTQHPLYRTSSATAYGARHMTSEFVPTSYHGRNQQFSKHLGNAGMYRNNSLNTTADKKYINQPST